MRIRNSLGSALLLAGLGSIPVVSASVVDNRVVDPGFEATSSLPSEPDGGTHPWFTLGEAKPGSLLRSAGRGRSGTQAVEWHAFHDNAALVQGLPDAVRIQEGVTYEFSVWARLAEATGSPAQSAPPTFNLAVYTAPEGAASYRFLTSAPHNLPSTSRWTRFRLLLTPEMLYGHAGERIQLRVHRPFSDVTHRLLIDDVSFGVYQRPNLLFILADDIGYGDIGVYHRDTTGQEPVVPTPNIDRLAQEGMRFMDAHTPAALCAPTRYSVMTGNNPYRGTERWGSWRLNSETQFLAGQKTVGEVMQAAGYNTAFFGKLHWGGDWREKGTGLIYRGDDLSRIDFTRKGALGPTERGFDYSFFTPNGVQGQPYAFFENDRFQRIDGTHSPDMVYLTPDILRGGAIGLDGWGDSDWDSRAVGRKLANRAVAFVDRHHRQNLADGTNVPFLMAYASQAIHIPNTPPPEFAPGIPVAGQTGLGAKADMIYELDLQVGRILGALRERGLLDNTLIVFTSDNGGRKPTTQEEIDAGHDSVGGLRGFKAQIWEGGHRVPFIVRWGNGSLVAPGAVSDLLISANDWVATLYALTGQAMPEGQAMDGADLLPALLGQQDENVPIHEFMLLQSSGEPWVYLRYGIRQGNHVLIVGDDTSPVELYDLHADLRQKHNLIADPAEVGRIAQMLRLFLAHKDPDSPRTVPLPTGRSAACADVSAGRCQADDRVRILGERTVTLTADQPVDRLVPAGATDGAPGAEGARLIPAGTTVSSYLLHFNPAQASGQAQISHTFNRPIVGIVHSPTGLDATDRIFGHPAIVYPTDEGAASTAYRGAIGEGAPDRISIGADARTIDVTLAVGFEGAVDQVRVLLRGEP